MAGQGKMHGSPFHVETARYKYAIEHETSDYIPQKPEIKCKYLKSNGNLCSLWNSGCSICLEFKCKKNNEELQNKSATCEKCAFCYKHQCFHMNCPACNDSVVNKTAEYCSFFLSEEQGERRFNYIRSRCKRVAYSRLIQELKKRLKRLRKQIRALEKEAESETIKDADRMTLASQLAAKTEEMERRQQKIDEYTEYLEKHGGELRRIDEKLPTRIPRKRRH